MRAQRAILVTRVYAPEGTAAAYRLAALARELEQAGYETLVLTTRSKQERRSTPLIRRWPVLRDRTGSVRGYLQFASFDIPAFFRLLFARRADFVVVEPPPTTGVAVRLAAGVRRTPYFYFAGDVSSVAARGLGVSPVVVRVLRSVEAWAMRGARGVFAVSEGVRTQVLALGVDSSRAVVVGTGVDTDDFSLAGPVENPGYPYFVYAGTMSELQGSSVFVEAFGRMCADFPQLRLRMFGSGVEQHQLEARAREVGDGRIDFPGSVPAEQLTPWVRGARASLASSKPRSGYEFAYATKALASMGCGTSVIYAGDGPVREVIADNDAGWAVDWDTSAVEQAMRAAAAAPPDPARAKRIADLVGEHYSLRAVGRNAIAAAQTLLAAIK